MEGDRDPLAPLATAYGVRADPQAVAAAIRRRLFGRRFPGGRRGRERKAMFLVVASMVVNAPDFLRTGRRPSQVPRKALIAGLRAYGIPSPEQFLNATLDEISSAVRAKA